MSVFRRRRDDSPGAAAPGAAATASSSPGGADSPAAVVPVARDPELGVPPFRPAPKEAPIVGAAAPRPNAAPASPVLGGAARPGGAGAAAGLAGARSVGAAAVPQGGGNAPRAEGTERRTLVVGKGISLQGTVSDAERLVVEGTVESQMIQAAELLITHSGVFKGEVEIEDAEIAGTFDGTLTATGNLIIRATGKVMGVARCRRLQVEEGGQISGRMEMLTDAALTGAAAARAPVPPALPPAATAAAPTATAATARTPEPAEA